MAYQVKLVDGEGIKSFALPEFQSGMWNYFGDPDIEHQDVELYSRVAAVFRVVNMTADAIANLPFAVLNSSGDTIDHSAEWQNVVGFMPRPRELLRLWRLSLFMTNSAYGFLSKTRAQPRAPLVSEVRYIVPDTITPDVDSENGLLGFKRQVGAETSYYERIDEGGPMFWMYWLDHTTELLPSHHTEFRALMAAAGALFYSDYYVEKFFKRGGIDPHMLLVKGSPTKEDRERIESLWTKIITLGDRFLGKVFNAETIEPVKLGSGVDNLTSAQLHQDKIEDIAIAAGIPISLLVASSANYATAQVEKDTWLRDIVIPKAAWMAESINHLLFEPAGYKFEFRYEEKSEMQEEERQRAMAYRLYVNAGMPPSVAAQVVGLDLPADIEYEQLDKMKDEVDLRQAQLQMFQGESRLEEHIPEPEVEADMLKSAPSLTMEQLRELDLWQQIAFRKLKRGDSLDFPFVCKTLDEGIASRIRGQLPACKTEDDIKRTFDLQTEDDALLALADALNRSVDKFIEVERDIQHYG